MAQPYVGEIRMFAGTFAPVGWMFCDGQTLPISENETLFQLIGTTYGGDGQSTFNLPNLQSRVPIHMGTSGGQTFILAEMAGVETVTLTAQQIPVHTHPIVASASPGTSTSPVGTVLAEASGTAGGELTYGTDPAIVAMNAQSLTQAGGSQPHDNMQPYLVISFIISLFGIFPTQN